MKTNQFLRTAGCAVAALLTIGLPSQQLQAQTSYSLTVKAGGLRQTFSGFGASQPENWNTIPLAKRNQMNDLVYKDLKANILRLWLECDENTTVTSMVSQFKARYVDTQLLTEIQARGVDTLLLAPCRSATGGYFWSVPPTEPLSTYAAKLAEAIAQIKNTLGVQINVTGIANEPGKWSNSDVVDCVNFLRAELNSRGLSNVKIIAPENSGSTDTMTAHIDALYNDGNGWNNIDGIASHSYWMLANDDQEVRKRDKEWWITEASDGGNEQPEDENRACTILARMLCELNHGVNKWLVFHGLGQYPDLSLNPASTAFLTVHDQATGNIVTYLKYYYFKQLLNTIDKGASFRSCVSATEGGMFKVNNQNPAINASAAVNPDGSWGIALVNDTGVPSDSSSLFYPATTYSVSVNVEELATIPSKTFTIYRSRANQHFVNSGTLTLLNGVGTISIAPKELVCLRSGAVAPTVPAVPTGLKAYNVNAPVTLLWNNSVGATSWKVKRATVNGGPYTNIATTNTTRYVDNTAVQGTLYYYVVSATNSVGESANSAQVSTPPSPFPWRNQDIGNTGLSGSWSVSETGVFTAHGAGVNISGAAEDVFNFTYTKMNGDGSLIARLAHANFVNTPNAKVGIMMRDSLAPNATAATLLYNRTSQGTLLYTRSSSGSNGGEQTGPTLNFPIWFKLTRSGSLFTAYVSSNGTTWTTVGGSSATMGNSIYIGMAVCSRKTDHLTKAVFDNVTAPPVTPVNLNSSASNGKATLKWTASYDATGYNIKRATNVAGPYTSIGTSSTLSYTDSTVVAGNTYHYQVAATNSVGTSADSTPYRAWLNQDVGTVGVAGSVDVSKDNVFSARGAGVNVGGNADSFNYTYSGMTGDGTFVARLASAPAITGNTAKVGIMMRGTLDANSQNVLLFYDFSSGYLKARMAVRGTVGATTSFIEGPALSLPVWLKLVRSGNSFAGYSSSNGTTWTSIGTTTVAMPGSIQAGFVVCSRNTGYAMPVTFDTVTVP